MQFFDPRLVVRLLLLRRENVLLKEPIQHRLLRRRRNIIQFSQIRAHVSGLISEDNQEIAGRLVGRFLNFDSLVR